jgi:ABC transporter
MDNAIGSLAPAVRARGISFAYGQGDACNQVLFDISIEIPPGQFVVMTVPSGSGKTTLLTLLGGLRTAQQGQIDLLGHDLWHLHSHHLVRIRREIGFIFQRHNLFESLTATENVRMVSSLVRLPRAKCARAPVKCWSSWGSPTASTISRTCYRLANANASRSPAPWPTAPGWSSPMSRPRRLTRMQPPMSSPG